MQEKKEITIYDIAKQLGLSAATVSRGLKDSLLVNAETRHRIKEAALQLGYRANSVASNLRMGQTKTLGVIVPYIDNYFMSAVLAAMESTANMHGYNLLIAQSVEDPEKERRNIHMMFRKRVDGLLISLAGRGSRNNLEHLAMFEAAHIPVVFFDRVPENYGVSVAIDNYNAACDITRHLVEQGCKNILHITGDAHDTVFANRISGFTDTLHQFGLPCTAAQLYYCNELHEAAGETSAAHILAMPQRPDGVFYASGPAAVTCMLALMKAGVRVPQDIAFAGFTDDAICTVITPPLTTVKYSPQIMGNTALQTLLSLLGTEIQPGRRKRHLIDHTLVIRGSTLTSMV